jgi:hypothetical protein
MVTGMIAVWPPLHLARRSNDVALTPALAKRQADRDAISHRSGQWLGITLAVVSAISLLVVAALSWLLNRPDPS